MAAQAATPVMGRRAGSCVAALMLAAGCQTTTTKSLPTTATPLTDADLQQLAPPASSGGTPVSSDEAVGTSPSAVRLEAIVGPLLMYLGNHHLMPPSLADLQPLTGDPLPAVDPAGRAYLYVPRGLVTAGFDPRIVVAEAAPSAGNVRWCILLPPTPAGAAALSASVLPVPEAVFQRYVPAE